MPEEMQADSTPKRVMPKRDKKGHFLPGVSGNPAGKPVGTLSLTAILKRKLGEELDDHGITAGERLVAVTIADALAGDSQSRKLCWEYIEGKARQTIDATITPVTDPVSEAAVTDGKVRALVDELIKSVSEGPDTGA